MDELKARLLLEAARWEAPPGDLRKVRILGRRRRILARLVASTMATALTLALAGTVFLVIDQVSVPRATYRGEGASGGWMTIRSGDYFVSHARVAASAFDVEIGDGSIWVLGCQDCSSAPSSTELLRVDPASGTVTGKAHVPHGVRLAYGFGSIWVTVPDLDSVARIDTRDMELEAKVPLELPSEALYPDDRFLLDGIDTEGGYVWFVSHRGAVALIDVL